MIKRYEVANISKIWSLKNRYETWLLIEKLIFDYHHQIGNISNEEWETIQKELEVDEKVIAQNETILKHDVFAFLKQVNDKLSVKSKKYLHFGATSTDIVDSANAYNLKQTNTIVSESLINLLNTLEGLAFRYKDTLQMGRTHGQSAEITTFGLKLANWYDELNRDIERFYLARKQIELIKISGAVGTHANPGLDLQNFVAVKLDMASADTSTQVISRDNYAFYFQTLNLIGLTIEKIATQLRTYARSEIDEINEGFAEGQKGSSAMPHKKNPIGLENLCGLSRLLLGYEMTSLMNVNLWDERDITHSSNERIILCDGPSIVVYLADKLNNILKNLVVNEKQMITNIEKSNNTCFSQTLLLKLIDKSSLNRMECYDLIQNLVQNAKNNNQDFKAIVLEDKTIKKYLTKQEILSCFDKKYHTKYIDSIFKKIFINHQKQHFEKILNYGWEVDYTINKLANWLNNYYLEANDKVIVFALLNGCIVFTGQLYPKLRFESELFPIKLSFYGDDTKFTAKDINWKEVIKDPSIVKGKNVLIIDDLIDQGKSIQVLINYLKDFYPKDIKSVVLCEKQTKTTEYHADWTGLFLPDDWISGFGIDFQNRFRNYNFLAAFGIKKNQK